jgi:hypothetical protein
MRQFQEPQQQQQTQPQSHPQSLQNYQAYNYTPQPQTGFVGYPTAVAAKIQLDAGAQNMGYVPSPKNAAPNMDFPANPAMALGSLSPTDTAAVTPVYTFSS